MPNHCCNLLKLYSNNFDDLNNFYVENKSTDEDLCFNKSIPIPKDEESNWHDWKCSNWGTKWNAYEIDYNKNEEDKTISYDFQTAWTPPVNWLDKISTKYLNIKFELEYSEPGCDFGGYIKYVDGNIESVHEYSLSEYNWAKVDKELLENVIDRYLSGVVALTVFENKKQKKQKKNFKKCISTRISDIVDIIYDIYSEEDEYYLNIHDYIEQEINRIIEDNYYYHLK